MNTSYVVEAVLHQPGVGDELENVIRADLQGVMKRILMRYPWRFNMAEGTETTTTANEYTLKGGTSGAAKDLAVIDSIKLGSTYEYLTYVSPRVFDMSKATEYGSGSIERYTIRKTDNNGFPIVEFLGSMASGETIYYYYRKKPGSDVSGIFPDEFIDVFTNYLFMKWATADPYRQQAFRDEYQRALMDMRNIHIDLSVLPPEYASLTRRQLDQAVCGNRNHNY